MGRSRVFEVLRMLGQMHAALPAATQASAGACTIVSDVSLSGLSAGVLTIAAQPDYPRTLRGILTDANGSITSGTVTIFGLDQNGVGISDVLTFTAAGSQYTTKAFAKVVSATWALGTGTVTTTDDKIAIGYGTALGLPAMAGASYKRLVKASFNGADEAGTFSATYGTYVPAGTLDAAKPLEVLYEYEYGLKWHDLNA